MLTALDLANSTVSAGALARHVGPESELGRALANTAERTQDAANAMYALSEAVAAMTPGEFRSALPASWWRRLRASAREAEQAPPVEQAEPAPAVAPDAPAEDVRPVFLIEDL